MHLNPTHQHHLKAFQDEASSHPGWPVQEVTSQKRGANKILDALEQREGVGQMRSGSAEMPPGFLERFAEEYEKESLPEIVATLGDHLIELLLLHPPPQCNLAIQGACRLIHF